MLVQDPERRRQEDRIKQGRDLLGKRAVRESGAGAERGLENYKTTRKFGSLCRRDGRRGGWVGKVLDHNAVLRKFQQG